MSTLTEIQSDVQQIAARVGPAVVGFGRGWGRGSGVVVAKDRVITCAHNLRDERVRVTFGDGRRAEGEVSGTAAALDLAVVSVDTGDAEPIEWEPAVAESVALGTAIVALGNPGGRGLRATPGFVASAGRSFRGPRGRRIENCVEHTAPLPAGSGGGPLVDLDGPPAGPQRAAPRRRPDPRRAGGPVARGPRRTRSAAVSTPSRCGSASRSPLRTSPGACAAPSACRSARACWCAASPTAAPPTAPGSCAAT